MLRFTVFMGAYALVTHYESHMTKDEIDPIGQNETNPTPHQNEQSPSFNPHQPTLPSQSNPQETSLSSRSGYPPVPRFSAEKNPTPDVTQATITVPSRPILPPLGSNYELLMHANPPPQYQPIGQSSVQDFNNSKIWIDSDTHGNLISTCKEISIIGTYDTQIVTLNPQSQTIIGENQKYSPQPSPMLLVPLRAKINDTLPSKATPSPLVFVSVAMDQTIKPNPLPSIQQADHTVVTEPSRDLMTKQYIKQLDHPIKEVVEIVDSDDENLNIKSDSNKLDLSLTL
ncbi:unnamed protein product [Ilex paraguariensis]|uniref:Uncharacterized protein n=1 Tax=Ilex paraguariensis TaxID=185542 RepID=A0ABC8TBS7_9AQUA